VFSKSFAKNEVLDFGKVSFINHFILAKKPTKNSQN
jgi:hypothetical protein